MLSKRPVLIIFSLAIALFLWTYVTGQLDPETKMRLVNIPVKVSHEDDLNDRGLAVVHDHELTTAAIISGKRSVVNQAKKNGITATVNVKNAMEGRNTIHITFNTPQGINVKDAGEQECEVMVEKRIEKEFDVQPVFTGSSNEEIVPWVTNMYPQTVIAYGAKSSISQISKVVVEIDSSSVTTTAKETFINPKALDAGDNVIGGIEFSVDNVSVEARLLQVKTVKLNFVYNNLSDSLKVESAAGATAIKVVASPEVLANLKNIDAVIDMTGVKSTGTVRRDIDIRTPANVDIYQDVNRAVKLSVIAVD